MSGDNYIVICEDCNGRGWVSDGVASLGCELCGGAGKVQLPSLFKLFKEVRELKIKVKNWEVSNENN